MRAGKRRALNKNSPWGSLLDKAEKLKASVRAKDEYPFRVITCPFGLTKVRYKGLAKNTEHLMTLFALNNVYGTKTFAGCVGMSSPAPQASVSKRHDKVLRKSPNVLKYGENAHRFSSNEILLLNYRCGGGF